MNRDHEIFSRQQLVLGTEGQSSVFNSSLCIVGCDGLAIEIAKNVLLAGILELVICDNESISSMDISNNICLRNTSSNDIGNTLRAEASLEGLKRFNPSASIIVRDSFEVDLAPSLVIVSNNSWSTTTLVTDACREHNIPIIVAFTGGLYYLLAMDLGTHRYDFENTEGSCTPISQLIGGKSMAGKLLTGIQTIHPFLSDPRSPTNFAKFFAKLSEAGSVAGHEELDFYRRFYFSSFASTVALNGIAGGLVAEQILKILSRCYQPLEGVSGHFFKNIYNEDLNSEDYSPGIDDVLYTSQIINFGRKNHEKILKTSALVLGAGALGNEFIKGAAMIGMGACPEASLVIVDNDIIMTSNLSRQLCFFENDIYKSKAPILCQRAKELFNPHINALPVIVKLDHATECHIGDAFFSKAAFFVSALDNVEGRKTLERISCMYDKPMIDGGTQGFEGSQDNYIPFQTYEYSKSVTEFEPESCTPKSNVKTTRDVIQNAKIHFEKLLGLCIHGKVKGDYFEVFLEDVMRVWQSVPEEELKKREKTEETMLRELKREKPDETMLRCNETEFNESVRRILEIPNLTQRFEKDEPAHVRSISLMCACISTLYAVSQPSASEIRKVAGKIIPTIISSTAVIGGLMLLSALQAALGPLEFGKIRAASLQDGRLVMFGASPHNPNKQSIYRFGKLQPSTLISEVVKCARSAFPEVEEIQFLATSTLSLPEPENLMNRRISELIREKCAVGPRKYLIAKIGFRRMTRENGEIIMETEEKFVILEL